MSDDDHDLPDGDEPKDRKTYTVGYGKTPEHTRFVKGHSGNPKGKKPGSKNLTTLIVMELDKTVIVTENGKKKSKRKSDVLVKQLVNKGVGGDFRASAFIISVLDKHDAVQRAASDSVVTSEDVTDADEQVMKEFLRRNTAGSDDK